MIDILGTLFGFILGIISSFLFWKYLLFLKPRLKISPIILKGSSLISDSKTVYRIKIFNNSNRPIVNISIKIVVGKLRLLKDGSQRAVIEKVLKEQTWAVLGSKKNIGNHWGLSPVYNISFDSTSEIDKLINSEDNVIQATIICSDSKSGSTYANRLKYTNNEILNGNFTYGLTFKIA